VLVLDTVAPVFLIVALGTWLQGSGFVSPGFFKEANKLTYWVGLPALLFHQLALALPSASGVGPLLSVMVVGTFATAAAAYVLAWGLRLPGPVVGTFVQGVFRGNLVFVGLPIIFALPNEPVAGGLTLHQAAVVVVAPVMVLYNLLGIVVLLLSQHRLSWAMLKPMLRQIAVTPPLLAIVGGMSFAASGWQLSPAVNLTLGALGEMALPLGLLGVGGSLLTSNLAKEWKLSAGAAWGKAALSPLIGWLVGRWWCLDPVGLKMVMIFMATPTAIISYTMALALKGDDRLASATIALSVIASLLALSVIIGGF